MARARNTRRKRGGDGKATRSVKLTSTSNQTYGYEHGTSPRDNALKYQSSQNNTQNSKNKTLGSTGGARRKRRGGTGCRPTKTTVTQFSTPGPAVSPIDASSTSKSANSTSLNAGVAATNDCHATNSCGPPPPTKPCPSGGGKKKRGTKRKYRRRRKAGSKTKKTKWGCMSGGKRGTPKRGRKGSKKRGASRRNRRR